MVVLFSLSASRARCSSKHMAIQQTCLPPLVSSCCLLNQLHVFEHFGYAIDWQPILVPRCPNVLNQSQREISADSLVYTMCHSDVSYICTSTHSDQVLGEIATTMSTPSSRGDHIQDLRNLLQGISLSDSSFNTVTWSCKTTEESITLSKSLLPQSTPAKKPSPTLPSTSARLHRPSHPPSTAISSHPQSQTVTQIPCQVTVPIPSEIHPPRASETPEGF